MNTKKKWK